MLPLNQPYNVRAVVESASLEDESADTLLARVVATEHSVKDVQKVLGRRSVLHALPVNSSEVHVFDESGFPIAAVASGPPPRLEDPGREKEASASKAPAVDAAVITEILRTLVRQNDLLLRASVVPGSYFPFTNVIGRDRAAVGGGVAASPTAAPGAKSPAPTPIPTESGDADGYTTGAEKNVLPRPRCAKCHCAPRWADNPEINKWAPANRSEKHGAGLGAAPPQASLPRQDKYGWEDRNGRGGLPRAGPVELAEFYENPAAEWHKVEKKCREALATRPKRRQLRQIVSDQGPETPRFAGAGGGEAVIPRFPPLQLPFSRTRRTPHRSLSELARYYTDLDPSDQSDLVGLLLNCRKLEKQIEQQHAMIALLESDLERVRTTLDTPPELRRRLLGAAESWPRPPDTESASKPFAIFDPDSSPVFLRGKVLCLPPEALAPSTAAAEEATPAASGAVSSPPTAKTHALAKPLASPRGPAPSGPTASPGPRASPGPTASPGSPALAAPKVPTLAPAKVGAKPLGPLKRPGLAPVAVAPPKMSVKVPLPRPKKPPFLQLPPKKGL